MQFHGNQYPKLQNMSPVIFKQNVKAVLNGEIVSCKLKHTECTSQWNEQYYNLNACKIWKHIYNILETTNLERFISIEICILWNYTNKISNVKKNKYRGLRFRLLNNDLYQNAWEGEGAGNSNWLVPNASTEEKGILNTGH